MTTDSPNEDVVSRLFGPPVPSYRGRFDEPADPRLTVDLLLVERPAGSTFGAWHVGGALVREQGGHAQWVPGWESIREDYIADADRVFDWLADWGGNGITTNVAYLKVEHTEDAPGVVAHFDRLLREDGHPLGFTGLPPIGPGADEPTPPVEATAASDPDCPCEHPELPFPVADALSWQVAARLIRRHPNDLWLVRTYFEAGGYDLLTVRRLDNPSRAPQIQINRNGTGAFIDWFGDPTHPAATKTPRMCWRDAIEPQDWHWYTDLERAAGLPPHTGRLPASTPSSIALRWIAAFIAAELSADRHWDAATYPDTRQGSLPEVFEQYTEAARWVRTQQVPGASKLVWFLHRGDRPGFAVGANGRLWRADGASHDLLQLYRRLGSSMPRLLRATVGE